MRTAIVRWRGEFAERFISRRNIPAASLITLLCLAGCAHSPAVVEIAARAEVAGFVAKSFNAGGFKLFALQKLAPDPGRILTVYIEGDGRAWRHRNQPSMDPTPHHATALALAIQDPGPAVLYLARPCQFLPQPLPPACDASVWTSHRYSESVITAMNAAITAAAAGFEKVALVGYSGGGSVAALIAARRSDVSFMITVAANLDHALWTNLHHVSPLTGSLNAADYAGAVQDIPQLHYLGGRDDIVPAQAVESYLARMSNRSKSDIRVEPDFGHECCWIEAWPRLLAEAGEFFH